LHGAVRGTVDVNIVITYDLKRRRLTSLETTNGTVRILGLKALRWLS
jgi:hypothetical protein